MALALAEPVFLETRPEVILREVIDWYEKESGKKLYPADDEMLLINMVVYRESLVRTIIQDVAGQNLVAKARAPMIDYLGHLVGVFRLPAIAAQDTLQFSVDEAPVTNILIPAGTRVSATDSVVFATDNDVLLMAGTLSVQVHATCTEAGIVGNGWQPAQISNLLDDIEGADFQVVAIAPSSGGAEAESDDHLRERIILAPESFSNAGSKGAYRFHAMSAHQDIVDVAVTRPQPGTVKLTPLMSYGMPEQAILDAIAGICSDEKIRPLTDTVITSLPDEVTYAINATLIVYEGQDEKSVLSEAEKSIVTWQTRTAAKLGLDIIPSQISAALSVSGMYKVELDSPGEQVLTDTQWAHCTAIRLTPGGKAHG
ncbi:baseplate protein [Salmonella enterica]|nr:baseplate protein [Salmonella enterica]EBX7466577.1 baseplate protein [Salmonella enterica subsp. enterica serovar Bareilly]EGS6512947.1 baseplate protein [Salmonella enterica]EHN7838017.1 baseplate J/gp47 family protein [Salmonella enterica]